MERVGGDQRVDPLDLGIAGNMSLFSSSGIPHDKSAHAKNRSKLRDLNSHLIFGFYPHFSEV